MEFSIPDCGGSLRGKIRPPDLKRNELTPITAKWRWISDFARYHLRRNGQPIRESSRRLFEFS